MVRLILCEDAHKFLDDFLYHALASWSSGRMADVMGCSEPELLYRAGILKDSMIEAEDIYKPQWKQLEFEDWL